MKNLVILGSTGSIGTQALEVAKMHGLKVIGIAAKSNADKLIEQIDEFSPSYVCIFDTEKAVYLKEKLFDRDIVIYSGMEGMCKLASLKEADIVLNSVVGMVGLMPTLAAIEAGKDIALANKETLVAGGKLVMESARRKGVNIYPVDSEHSAIFQSLQGSKRSQLSKIVLTASGGPFFGKTKDDLLGVTLSQALAHPNWSMGNKITIDSATLMNKGLEFVEAMWLFDAEPDMIEIVVHRESVIHSAVEFDDGAVIAELGVPDMKIPIQYALLYPERLACPTKRLSLTDYGTLSFFKPDYDTFDCLSACIKAARIGGTAPAIVNGANEEAVAAFISGKIKFLDIGKLVTGSLEAVQHTDVESLDDILSADRMAREYVINYVNTH